MAQCKKCNTTENIVHSGVDALLLGIPGAETEKICYPCANTDREKKQEETEIPSA
jgi:hypothetical protein